MAGETGATGSGDAFRLPATVSAPALLEDGSDARFRQMVYDLFTVSVRMEAVRDALARRIGVTGPQYSILMAVARLQGAAGVPVRRVADQLHVTGPFVTAEAGKLVRRGLLAKTPNPGDGRSVLLRLAPAGEAALERLAPTVRAVNDRFWGALDRGSFVTLAQTAALLVRDSEAALAAARTPAEPRDAAAPPDVASNGALDGPS